MTRRQPILIDGGVRSLGLGGSEAAKRKAEVECLGFYVIFERHWTSSTAKERRWAGVIWQR
jgi:hypothetical protein